MNANDLLQLQQPVKEGGIRSVNFFNGRLLAGKDLSREQAARREADRRLGLALGEGVAFGLEVARDPVKSTDTAPVLRVAKGLAVNRNGQLLHLTEDTPVAVSRRFDAVTSTCTFAGCGEIAAGKYVAGAGVYVLTVAPAETTEGRVPTNGLDPTSVRCDTDVTVEGLQFRLHEVRQQEYAALGLGQPWFRNVLAYRCFGEDVQPSWLAGLLDAPARREPLLDALRRTTMTDHDVPLALLQVGGVARVEFIDEWAVRRPLSRASASQWASLVDERRLAVGRAMLLQFQRQLLDGAAPSGDLGAVTARTHFRYLPPAGVIPVPAAAPAGASPGDRQAADDAARRFFAGMTVRGPVHVNAAQVESVLRESLCYPPIDTRGGELVWLYRAHENAQAVDFAGAGEARPRSYLLFASGQMPYRGDARFDVAHWDYANYALAR